MVQGGVDAVDANGVDAKLLHVRDVSAAAIRIGERVHEVAGLREGRPVRRRVVNIAVEQPDSQVNPMNEVIASAGKAYGSELVMSPCSWYARP